ncbi:MAG: LysR family transcriptional regulator [Marinibacterium sp.]|nr:LysR family transcriptional regulator [Marinibacterium sp.]
MNWQAISFDWNQVRAFLATVEEGSLSAAARALRQTQPTLSRQVSALEEALGVVLFERVGKTLVLTQAGVELVDHVRDMANAASRISLSATGQSQSVEGRVRITASDGMAAYIMPGILQRLRKSAPGIAVDLIASNSVQDLMRREADIGIRHVRPEQPDLIARLVRTSAARFVASDAYFRTHGRPESVETLAKGVFVGFDTSEAMLPYMHQMGIPLTADNFHWVTNNGVAYVEMVRRGLGIGVLMDEIVDMFPNLVPVIPELPEMPIETWLATHRELHSSRSIRVVFDLLADTLS